MKAHFQRLLPASLFLLTISLSVLSWPMIIPTAFTGLMKILAVTTGLAGLAMGGVYYWLSRSISREQSTSSLNQAVKPKAHLPKLNREFDQLTAHSREIICVLDKKLNIQYINQAVTPILGFAPEELIGKTPFQLSVPEHIERLPPDEPDSKRYHFQMKKKNGQEIWLEAKLVYLKNEQNEATQLSAYVTEISAFKKQSQILEQMQQLANIGSWEYIIETEHFYATEQVSLLFNVEHQQKKLNFNDLLHFFDPQSRNLIQREFKQALDYKKSWDLELSFTDWEGNVKWLRTVGSPYSRNGKVYKLAGTLQDITEHIAFEELIIKKQNELKAFVENTPVAVAMFDKDMQYIAASYKWCEYYDLKQEHIKGRHCYESIPNMPEEWKNAHTRSLNGEVIFMEEDTFRKQNGQIEWVKWEMRPWHKEDHQTGGLVMFVENISHQKKLAEISRKQQKRMEEIYRITSDNSGNFHAQLHQMLRIATWALNMEHGVFHRIEKNSAHIIGSYSVTDLFQEGLEFSLNQSYASITYQLDKLLAIPHFNQSAFCALNCYKTHKMEAYIGVPVWVRGERFGTLDFMATSPLSQDFQQADKDFVQLLGQWISSAIERQQYEHELIVSKEKAEEASKAKEQFLSIMSHEIRTPMNAVVGISHLLLQEEPKAEQIESLHTLQFSANNLLALINDILDFSKIEAGKIDLEIVDFNLNDMLHKLSRLMQPAAKEKSIELFIKIDPDTPDVIQGDSVRLNQILTNLLSNAIKFTHTGHVSLEVVPLEKKEEKIVLQFKVTDTGIGIPKDKLSMIFDSFSQASSDTTRKYGGTGLGLAITKKLVALQKGQIEVTSELQEGTTFQVVLPFTKTDQNIKTLSQPSSTTTNDSLIGVKVLLVEDQEINQFVAKRFLKKWGVEIEVANNGREGYEMASIKAYDIILMDLQMPEMDGYEASRKIRELEDPYFKKVPILALTAAALSGVRQSVLNAGMNDHISKPFDPSELHDKLKKYCLDAELNAEVTD